ncbi:hypothetical protein HMPREF9547_04414 [Escherichia coli MS 175-1]|nr:hypothetical protein ECDG_03420 [Escherichia coli B185]EFF11866.1 conserved hypothetical protein [Escherichia coli B354]EFI86473.1 hypothetical protein HMPREF9551_04581 [Escherichia coli MS 196-1]EFJ64437.1 hypothetical protein HMPREF9547_04414 [Escherichia coli MS 175-1]EFK21086.1 hypothetical protein HMPREF9530_02290 [Escherichia coli MS 21-1]EGJ05633.1 hypothetical protein SSJG_01681 [Escherichia coli D9]EKK63927.1 hypothetical protein EC100869_4233 [Escherichia coli 10.0869]KXH03069.1
MHAVTQACFSITKFDKIPLFHNIISAFFRADCLHKNSSVCTIMLYQPPYRVTYAKLG